MSRRLPILILVTTLLIGFSLGGHAEELYPQGGGIQGRILGFDMHDQLVPLSWATVIAEIDGEVVAEASSHDGYYEMFVPGGEVTLTVEHPGYISQMADVYVSPGSSTTINFTLERSNEPIPEYAVYIAPIVMAIAMITLLIALRKRGLLLR